MTFGEAVKAVRAAVAEAQPAFAKRLGVSFGSLQKYEQDEVTPSPENMVKVWRLAREFGPAEAERLIRSASLDIAGRLVVDELGHFADSFRDASGKAFNALMAIRRPESGKDPERLLCELQEFLDAQAAHAEAVWKWATEAHG